MYAPNRQLPNLPLPLPYEPIRCRSCSACLNPYWCVDSLSSCFLSLRFQLDRVGVSMIMFLYGWNVFFFTFFFYIFFIYVGLSAVNFNSKSWDCPFCLTKNDFPASYADIQPNNLPAELFPQYTTIEYSLDRVPPQVGKSLHSISCLFFFFFFFRSCVFPISSFL